MINYAPHVAHVLNIIELLRNQFLNKKKGFNANVFGDRVVDAIRGVIHGYFPFRQDKLFYTINPALGTPEIHTYTYGTLTTLTGGTFSILLPNGEYAGEFLFNASAATIAGLICNTNIARRSGWIPHGSTGANVTVVNNLATATPTLTITIYDPEGNFLKKPIRIVEAAGLGTGTIAGTGTNSTASTCVITQKGQSGLYNTGSGFTATNGAAYDIYLYAFMYKHARYYPQMGAIKVEFLSVY